MRLSALWPRLPQTPIGKECNKRDRRQSERVDAKFAGTKKPSHHRKQQELQTNLDDVDSTEANAPNARRRLLATGSSLVSIFNIRWLTNQLIAFWSWTRIRKLQSAASTRGICQSVNQ